MLPNKGNYFADAEPSAPSGPDDEPTAPEKEEAGDSQTAEIPKAALGGKEFKSTKFKFHIVPITVKCNNCGFSGGAKSIDTHLPDPKLAIACPRCGLHDLSITTGQELEIEDVKVSTRRRNA